jgi:hypothetical protein
MRAAIDASMIDQRIGALSLGRTVVHHGRLASKARKERSNVAS